MMWEMTFNTPVPEGKHILHHPLMCRYRRCCNPAHLRPGTQGDNMQDMLKAGRAGGKLTASEVIMMRSIYAAGGYTHRQLGKMYGVARETVTRIITRRAWRHI